MLNTDRVSIEGKKCLLSERQIVVMAVEVVARVSVVGCALHSFERQHLLRGRRDELMITTCFDDSAEVALGGSLNHACAQE